MTSTSKTLLRLCVPGLAAVTMVAGSPLIGLGFSTASAQAPLTPSRIIANDCPDPTATTTTATNNQGTATPTVNTAPATACRTQAQTGQVKTLTFTEVTADGTPVANRNLVFELDNTANPTASFTATQPAGSSSTIDPRVVRCLTNSGGQCSVSLTATAPGDASVFVFDEAAGRTVINNTEVVEFRNGSVEPAVLVSAERIVVAPDNVTVPTPGRPVQRTFTVVDQGSTTGTGARESAVVRGAALTLTLNRQAYFTNNCTGTNSAGTANAGQPTRTANTTPQTGRLVAPTYQNCTFTPAPAAGAQVGALNNLGQTLNVVTDQNGQFTVTIAEGRDAAFDDNGAVSVTLTAATAGGSTFSTGTGDSGTGAGAVQAANETFLSVAPLNGAEVRIVPVDGNTLSNTQTNDVQDRTLSQANIPASPGARTFVLRLRDQYGNLTASGNAAQGGVAGDAAQDSLTLSKTGVGTLVRCTSQATTTDPCPTGTDVGTAGNPGTTDQIARGLQGSFLNPTAPLGATGTIQERFQLTSENLNTNNIEQGLATIVARWAAPRTTYTFSTGTTPRINGFDQASTANVLTDTARFDFYTPVPGVTITQTPNDATVPAGTVVTEQATVRDQRGQAIRNSRVTFLRSGDSNNCTSSDVNGTGSGATNIPTNAQGQASFTFTCATASTQNVTAIASDFSNNELARAQRSVTFGAFVAGTPAATSTASTQPSATTTASTQPTTPASSAPATTRPSTPAPTGSVSPPVGIQCVNPVGITLNREFITPGVPVRVTVNAPVGADVQLQAYSRPSTEFAVVRQGTVADASGNISFDIVPGTNTRLFANCVSQTRSASAQRVVNVRTALSLTVVRNGTRNYTFQGRILPRRAGQLITLYRVERNGTRILTSQLRTDATGTYRINRRFTGSGTFGFLTRTGQTLTNAAGESNTPNTVEGTNAGTGAARPTAIF